MIPMTSRLAQAVQSSLTIKVFTICFLSVHVPLLVFIIYLASGFATQPEPVLILLLAATLAGTAICLLTLWWLIRPLRQLAQAVKTYQQDGTPVRMQMDSRDEIGLLATTVTSMVAETENLMAKLRHQAMTDPLTGLGNRRWLAERMAEEMSRAERQCEPLSVVVFDLDRFKAINDSHGHETGDRVLVAVAEIVRTSLRRYDLAARVGGEEFCIILPRTSLDDAEVISERLRATLAATVVPPLRRGRMTASFGICDAGTETRLSVLLQRADTALYEAKRDGRNCIRRAAPQETGAAFATAAEQAKPEDVSAQSEAIEDARPESRSSTQPVSQEP
jgi:diguanylate cyclase (GGDEF)-like protein